jgi:hypothetical protein
MDQQRDLALDLLTKFIKAHSLLKLFKQKCLMIGQDERKNESLAVLISNLPDRLACLPLHTNNNNSNPLFYYPKRYFAIVIGDLNSSLAFVYELLKQSKDVSIEFSALVFGRLCLLGHTGISINWSLSMSSSILMFVCLVL